MVTASAGRADKGSSLGSRAFRAPLQCDRLAVGGQGRGEEKPKARQPSSCAQTQGATMSDPEIEELRDKVHCAVVLERTPPPWKLDRKESTKLSLKYRRGKGEILIVSHGGKGWWDPTSDAKGDVFGLVQRLEPGINFGHVRKRLREFAGLPPSFPIAERAGRRENPERPVAERWAERKAVWPNSSTWRHLALKRWFPRAVIEAASTARVLREGPRGSAWFAHYDGTCAVSHVDVRGPTYKGSLTGGAKAPFVCPHRLNASRGSFSPRPRLTLEASPPSRVFVLIRSTRQPAGHGARHHRRARGAARGNGDAPARTLLQRYGRQSTGRSLRRSPPIARGKNSVCRSRGFGLQSKAATGTTFSAPDPKRQERRHILCGTTHRTLGVDPPVQTKSSYGRSKRMTAPIVTIS